MNTFSIGFRSRPQGGKCRPEGACITERRMIIIVPTVAVIAGAAFKTLGLYSRIRPLFIVATASWRNPTNRRPVERCACVIVDVGKSMSLEPHMISRIDIHAGFHVTYRQESRCHRQGPRT